jgi:hypothetical protein
MYDIESVVAAIVDPRARAMSAHSAANRDS